MRYEVNGKIFDTVDAAEKYEKELKAEEIKKKKFAAERDSRQKEVNDAYNKYQELRDKFYEDYPNDSLFIKGKRASYNDKWSDIFDALGF